MKIYKYWKILRKKVKVEGEEFDLTGYGGSNISPEDALDKAGIKLEIIRRKLPGKLDSLEQYEVEIREEIIQPVSESAVITRNRYGALVLNVERTMIIDIDKPKTKFFDLFKKKDLTKGKENIIEMITDYVRNSNSQYTYRIYETNKGMRVIVLGREFHIDDPVSINIMKDLNCDPLYLLLCKKQKCYRARLTPKPSTMKLKALKIIYPKEEDLTAKNNWIREYDSKRENYSVCRFIKQIGGNAASDEIVNLHDEITGAHRGNPLA